MCKICLVEKKDIDVFSKTDDWDTLATPSQFNLLNGINYILFWYSYLNKKNVIIDIIKNYPFITDINNVIYGACKGGHYNLVIYIINSYTFKLEMINSFYHACFGGNIELINFLIKKGANDWNGGLLGACIGKQNYVIKFLIQKGACFSEKIGGHTCDWQKYFQDLFFWLIDNGITREQIKNINKNKSITLPINRLLKNLNKKNKKIKEEIGELIIEDIDNIIIEYSCC